MAEAQKSTAQKNTTQNSPVRKDLEKLKPYWEVRVEGEYIARNPRKEARIEPFQLVVRLKDNLLAIRTIRRLYLNKPSFMRKRYPEWSRWRTSRIMHQEYVAKNGEPAPRILDINAMNLDQIREHIIVNGFDQTFRKEMPDPENPQKMITMVHTGINVELFEDDLISLRKAVFLVNQNQYEKLQKFMDEYAEEKLISSLNSEEDLFGIEPEEEKRLQL